MTIETGANPKLQLRLLYNIMAVYIVPVGLLFIQEDHVCVVVVVETPIYIVLRSIAS